MTAITFLLFLLFFISDRTGLNPDHDVFASESYLFGVVPQFEQRKLYAIWDPIIKELEKRTGLDFTLATTL